MKEYTNIHARAGLKVKLPIIACFPNQFTGYAITIVNPEFTSVCPRTGLPDFGTLTIKYIPAKLCVELKSLKMYLHGYRQIGIFQENVVNRILNDLVAAGKPVWAKVIGEFNVRGGLKTIVEAEFPRSRKDL